MEESWPTRRGDPARAGRGDRPRSRPARSPEQTARTVASLCRREALFPAGSTAVVMISGGQDSVTLLHLLATGGLGKAGPDAVHALHIAHGLRGDESEQDRLLAERHCADLGVPLTVHAGRLAKGMPDLQEAAREIRRAAAVAVAGEVSASVIALGHTLDDQVETVLYRLGRYGGLAASAGMSAQAGPWVRPLLTCRRADTEAYCASHGLEFARDRGNADPIYARTGIRRRVLPAWEEVLPGAAEVAARGAEVAAEVGRLVQGWVAECGVWVGPPGEAGSSISAVRLMAVDAALRRAVLHTLFEGLPGAHRTRALALAAEDLLSHSGSARLALGGGWSLVKEYGRVRVVTEQEGEGDGPAIRGPDAELRQESVMLDLPGTAGWRDLVVSAERVPEVRAHDPRSEAYLDERALPAPLEVRAPRAGDRMRPLGAPGSRSLQDVLVDLRVPRSLRDHLPLVLSGGRTVWLAGSVVAEEGRIRADTRGVVRLAVEKRLEVGRGAGS